MTASTSPSLLLRIRNAHDNGAWQEFMDLYSPVICDYCLRAGLQASDADDIVQDVMSIVSSAIQKFEYDPAKGRFRSWLGTIAANRIRNHFAKLSNRNNQSLHGFESDLTHISISQTYADPDLAWVELFTERIFQVAWMRIRPEISEVQCHCFEATWVRNEDAADVARSMQIPVHQVYVNKSRVLKRLEAEVRILAQEIPFSDSVDYDGANSF
ncbi:MAG TPA: sigma-70 family RNA polymerase sigma factor [Pirellulaceae bacterium]|nr:sigma-70 family RNA polymerase sigma factor [Pirellulaceae bacterium]